MAHFIKKVGITLGAFFVVIILIGYIYQQIGLRQDSQQIKPPGKLFTINDTQMHLYCTGSGSPTVVLEAASGGLGSSWGWVQPEVSKYTRVCSYDRRGRGWSTGDSQNLDLEQVSKDLHAVLWAAQINDRYILVGHSLGGLYSRKYQERYPEEVVGLVLIDSSHPSQFVTIPELSEKSQSAVKEFNTYALLSQTGLFRFYFTLGGTLDFSTLPDKERQEHAYFWSRSEHFYSMANENAQVEKIYDQAQKLGSVDPIPVRLISAADATPEWERLQNDLFTISKDSSRITIPDSTHMSLLFDKNHAERVSTVITTLINNLEEEK
jgi:pimeloyl-ACP methyl ester carboxylesterase